jgi:hypothetical protein
MHAKHWSPLGTTRAPAPPSVSEQRERDGHDEQPCGDAARFAAADAARHRGKQRHRRPEAGAGEQDRERHDEVRSLELRAEIVAQPDHRREHDRAE